MIGRPTGREAPSSAAGAADRGDAAAIVARIESIAPGDATFRRELIGVFVQDIDERLGHVSAGIAAHDAEVVQMQSHAIKGAAATAGADGLFQLALALEREAAAGEISGARRLFGRLCSLFESTREALEAGRGEGFERRRA